MSGEGRQVVAIDDSEPVLDAESSMLRFKGSKAGRIAYVLIAMVEWDQLSSAYFSDDAARRELAQIADGVSPTDTVEALHFQVAYSVGGKSQQSSSSVDEVEREQEERVAPSDRPYPPG